MADKTICMRCKNAGAKSLIPYKIIEDKDGQSVKFIGQLCEKCYNELFSGPPSTNNTNESKKEN